jgi:hypothetical protein
MRDVLLQPVSGGVGPLWHVNALAFAYFGLKGMFCIDQ